MKYRKDFVTNSSSSSYVCEICGAEASGWDIGLSDAEMVECENGHTICESCMLPVPRDEVIQEILSYQKEYAEYCDEIHSEEELQAMNDDQLLQALFSLSEGRYSVPEGLCPICQFIEYSNGDLAEYLEKEYKVSRDEVFAEIKKLNKRRKKLYDSEYVVEVCKRFNLNPAEIIVSLKDRFGTYRAFKEYIR